MHTTPSDVGPPASQCASPVFLVVFIQHCSQDKSRYSCKNICGNTDKLLEYTVSVGMFYKGVTTLSVVMPKISVLKLSNKA